MIKIQPTKFQEYLYELFNNNIRNFFFIMAAFTFLIIVRIIIFYFAYEIHLNWSNAGERFVSLMINPELAFSTHESFLEVHNFIIMIQALLLLLFMILLIIVTERNYFKIIKLQEQNLIFLNSIEVQGLKNLKFAQTFEQIISLMKPGEEFILKTCYIYDMTHYFQMKKKRELLSNSSLSSHRSDTESLTLKSLFENIKEEHFTGKMIICFSHISIVKELINVYHAGIFLEKLKNDLENAKETESYSSKKIKTIDKFMDNENYLKKISIQMAQDLNDIIWENYYRISKRKRQLSIFFIYFLLCCCFWFSSGFLEYLKTKNQLTINFLDPSNSFNLNLIIFQFRTSGFQIGMLILKLSIQLIGYFILKSLLM